MRFSALTTTITDIASISILANAPVLGANGLSGPRNPIIDPKKFIDPVIESLRAELRRDLVGVVLCGSYAYGVPGKNSDIDLQAVIRPGWKQRRWLTYQGVAIDLFLRPAVVIRSEFAALDRGVVTMFSKGRILMDSDGTIEKLVDEARRIIKEPLPPIPPGEWPALRQGAISFIKSVEDTAEIDEVSTAYTMLAALHEILFIYSRLERRRFGKASHQLPLE